MKELMFCNVCFYIGEGDVCPNCKQLLNQVTPFEFGLMIGTEDLAIVNPYPEDSPEHCEFEEGVEEANG